MFRGRLPANVYLLGLLSLFNDVTADMISPLLPAYLASMGLGAGFLGLMEGLANSLSNMTMLFSGWYADRRGNSKSLTVGGYVVAAVSRLFLAIPLPQVAIAARVADRIGKGIRTAPRDSLLTSCVDRKRWGEAFGVQRAMDHSGALLGPLIAGVLLAAFALNLSTLFLVASIPSVISILIVPRFLKPAPALRPNPGGGLSWRRLPKALKIYVVVMFVSALSTPSELFLILKLGEFGVPAYHMSLAWFVMTLATLVASYLGGRISDAWSRRRTIALGWTLFAVVYVGFAVASPAMTWVLIGLYGFQTGIIEAAERAYPALIASEEERATAIGWYYFSYGMGLLPASLVFGMIWDRFGPRPAFLSYAILTCVAVALLALLPSDRKKMPEKPEADS